MGPGLGRAWAGPKSLGLGPGSGLSPSPAHHYLHDVEDRSVELAVTSITGSLEQGKGNVAGKSGAKGTQKQEKDGSHKVALVTLEKLDERQTENRSAVEIYAVSRELNYP
ncbi:hypothetical protein C8R43DRAFT_957567 [Mycena crocata]|nr:hypothetical protein C8R43DRAFT_957567 [Mycena crocata]